MLTVAYLAVAVLVGLLIGIVCTVILSHVPVPGPEGKRGPAGFPGATGFPGRDGMSCDCPWCKSGDTTNHPTREHLE